MVDFPWYMGMAPLLGWCLDAVVGSRRLDPLFPGVVRRSATRFEFVLRQAFPNNPERAGWMLVLWIGAAAWLLGWILTSGSWVLAGHSISFAVWTALFFIALSVRSQATSGLQMQRALETEHDESAAEWLRSLGEKGELGDDREALAGASVRQLAHSIVRSALLPLFWGLFLGAGGALAALAVHLVARETTEDQLDDPFWKSVNQAEVWITTAPSWLALVFIQTALPFAGGQRGPAMAGFLNRYKERPLDRIAAAVAYGLNLGPSAGGHEDGMEVSPTDIHRATILLWTATALGATATSLAASLLYRFIL
jgi:cobalamin biosynthesis protein CobD/CbiB